MWTRFYGQTSFMEATFSHIHFSYAAFSKASIFGGVTFTETSNFIGTTFAGTLCTFGGTNFSRSAHFEGAKFSCPTTFMGATFYGEARFDNATFSRSVSFNKKCTFNKPANFINCEFRTTTNFSEGYFKYAPEFHNATLHQDTNFHRTNFKHKGSEHVRYARAWRTLKIAMNKVHNHEMELEFFGFEMDEKRKIELDYFKDLGIIKHLVKSAGIGVYKMVAGYGTSIGRPLLSLMLVTLLFAIGYQQCTDISDFPRALEYSIAQSFPFTITSKMSIGSVSADYKWLLLFANTVQSALSVMSLFLLALGLKNQFSIK